MNNLDSLKSTYTEQYNAVRSYLLKELGTSAIRDAEDFERDGVIFRSADEKSFPFRVFVSHEFLSDFSVSEALKRLRSWHVGEKARELRRGLTLFVTTDGLFVERTEGRTLRQSAEIFDSLLPTSQKRSELYERVFLVPIDGTPLGEIPAIMRGDAELYTTYSDEFANIVGATYLLDAAGYRDFQIATVVPLGAPDLQVTLSDGRTIYLEFKRAQNFADYRADSLLEQINVFLRRAQRDDPTISNATRGRFIEISVPNPPENRNAVEAASNEIIRFVSSVDWNRLQSKSLVPFDPAEFPVLTSLGARVYVTTGATHLSVSAGARSFDPNEPFILAARLIRTMSAKHYAINPVWLGISLADQLPLLPDSLPNILELSGLSVSDTPFEEIIVGSAGSAQKYVRNER